MKKQTINKIITKKFNDWLNSITDPIVKEAVRKNTIITGGCITSMFLKEKVNDFDVYFKDIRTTYLVAEYYAKIMSDLHSTDIRPQVCLKYEDNKFVENISGSDLPISKGGWLGLELLKELRESNINNSNDNEEKYKSFLDNILNTYIPSELEDIKYRVRCFIQSKGVVGDPNAQYDDSEEIAEDNVLDEIEENVVATEALNYNVTNPKVDQKTEDVFNKYKPIFISSNAITLSHKIQIVLRFYGDPAVIHSNYDFIHVTNYWTSWDQKIVTNTRALESILAKELLYIGSRYPLASIIRMKKFINRGWTCNAGQIVKMVMQLNDLDLNNPYILEEQLTGVDVAYFHQLLRTIRQKYENALANNSEFDVRSYFLSVVSKMFDGDDINQEKKEIDASFN